MPVGSAGEIPVPAGDFDRAMKEEMRLSGTFRFPCSFRQPLLSCVLMLLYEGDSFGQGLHRNLYPACAAYIAALGEVPEYRGAAFVWTC